MWPLESTEVAKSPLAQFMGERCVQLLCTGSYDSMVAVQGWQEYLEAQSEGRSGEQPEHWQT